MMISDDSRAEIEREAVVRTLRVLTAEARLFADRIRPLPVPIGQQHSDQLRAWKAAGVDDFHAYLEGRLDRITKKILDLDA